MGRLLDGLRWKRIVAISAALFAISMVLIVAFELSTGRAVSTYTGGTSNSGVGTSVPGLSGTGQKSPDVEPDGSLPGDGQDGDVSHEQVPQEDDGVPPEQVPQEDGGGVPPEQVPQEDGGGVPPEQVPQEDSAQEEAPPADAPLQEPAPQPAPEQPAPVVPAP